MIGLNVGSGQRPFAKPNWVNIDINYKWEPDIVADGADLKDWTEWNSTVDYFCLHHVLEHYGCGEARGVIDEAYRVLKPGGSLLIFVPDMRALAKAWLEGRISTQVYLTNVYGAYIDNEADRHRWGFDYASLREFVDQPQYKWAQVKSFDWRTIEGADIARDWWVLSLEVVK